MFASAWQLLTAIFFLSALTKLIYKLIKEVDRRLASSHHHQAAATFQQAEAVEPEVEAEGQLEFALEQQLRHRRSSLSRVSWSSPASPSSSSLSSSSTWNSPNSWAAGRQSEQQQQQQQEAQDSDEEELVFEEALTFVLSQATGGPTPSQLEEERRLQEARWLSRQLFRRQLNRLAAEQSSQSEPLGQLGEEGAQVEGEQGERALEEDGDEKRAHSREHSENLDFASINFEHNQSLSGFEGATRSALSERKWWTLNLSYLIAEVFLLEPVKLTLNILSGTFAIFCGFLDFIEGIEHSAAHEIGAGPGQAGTRSRQATSLPRGAKRSGSNPKGAATAAQQVTRQQATRGQVGPLGQQEAGEERRSNYFHRRYFSRRSLSAALLSDHQDQVAA